MLLLLSSLCCRVRSLIIQQEKAQDREKLLLKFIKIMKVCQKLGLTCVVSTLHRRKPTFFCLLQHLRKLNNFNSYLAILSALDSAPIRRLEWQKQTSEVRRGQGKAYSHTLVLRLFDSFFISLIQCCLDIVCSGIGGILHLDWQLLLLQSIQSCSGWCGASLHPIPVSALLQWPFRQNHKKQFHTLNYNLL